MTRIEWAEEVWNPIAGCSLVSPGCTNCYAMRAAWRLSKNPATPHYRGTVKMVNGRPVWTGAVNPAADAVLRKPLGRKTPTRYFVNSMGDLFHEAVPDEAIDRVFAVMALCPQHDFLVLTKRSARMREYLKPFDRRRSDGLGEAVIALGYDGHLESLPWPLPNVWLGVSAEDQRRADERIPELLATPAAVRFVSAEPLLGPIDLTAIERTREIGYMRPLDGRFRTLDWIIAGGESGPGARPCRIDWIARIAHQCRAAAAPLFVKQLGAWPVYGDGRPCRLADAKGGDPAEWPRFLQIRQFPATRKSQEADHA